MDKYLVLQKTGGLVTALGVSTLSPDSTGMCDRLRAGIPPRYVSSATQGQLILARLTSVDAVSSGDGSGHR